MNQDECLLAHTCYNDYSPSHAPHRDTGYLWRLPQRGPPPAETDGLPPGRGTHADEQSAANGSSRMQTHRPQHTQHVREFEREIYPRAEVLYRTSVYVMNKISMLQYFALDQ